jgi:hypothetical protein
MDGTARSKGSPASERTVTKFIGRKRSCQRKPPLGSSSTPWAGGLLMRCRRSQAMGPRYWLLRLPAGGCRFYSVVKDPRRGKRQGRGEPRAQVSGARVYGSRAGVSPQAGYSGEARAPKLIIQEGKKGIRGLMIVFREIQPVIGSPGERMTRRTGEFPGMIAGTK